MTESLMFVQFPHPGPEHKPAGQWMDWNRREHARKFLKGEGRYFSGGEVRSGPFAFWGEWEPQSRVLETFPDGRPGHPRWLHEPYWQVPRHNRLLQNTDPLVFGDRFLYSNCRQGRNRKLRELAPGSVVVFGSKYHGDFVMDTVFVVSDKSEEFTPNTTDGIPCEDWVRAVVFDPLGASAKRPDEPFRLYGGTTYTDAPNGLFSFVPCLPYRAEGGGFARPALRLSERWIKPNLAMGAKATAATNTQLRELWEAIVGEVTDAGLALGVAIEAPTPAGASFSPNLDG